MGSKLASQKAMKLGSKGKLKGKAVFFRAQEFWQKKTLDQLASEQAVKPVQRLDEVLGAGD